MTDDKPSAEVPDSQDAPAADATADNPVVTSASTAAAPDTSQAASEFEQLGDGQQMSLPAEFWLFIKEEKKWWLTPIILVLLGVGALVALTSTGAAPFIYTLF
ncbi:MAG TPA: hypothetical protein EYG03_03450 [Planctomycetes bacterium]|nr:hypothetical protein [Fuerstiella sp.]HIK91034.1 hypothetical protein [Planctomycetota bacterium]